MLKEFKKFVMRGNVLDMAVGVVIGGAFGKITTSLVNDIIMPFISMLTGGLDFSQWKWVLKEVVLDAEGAVLSPAVSVNFGNLIAVILDFLIIAFVIFLLVRTVNKLREALEKKEEEPAPAPEEPKGPTQEELLTEIRDLLKAQK